MATTTDGKPQKLFLRIEDMVNGGPSFPLQCHAWATVSEVKKQLEKKLKVMHSSLRLFYKNIELSKNGDSLANYNLENSETLTVKITPQLENSIGVINPYGIFDKPPKPVLVMIDNIKTGFYKGLKPKLTDNGTSGSYFLQDHNFKTVAIFKPYDEQPFAPNNPRKYVGQLGSQGFRKGILSGQSAARQVAAYLLDSEGFHGVPPTTYIEFYHPSFSDNQNIDNGPIKSSRQFKLSNQTKTKHGSLQAFIPHDDTIGNYGANSFSVEQIHKIAILDIRMLNCDRNDTNILVKKYNVQIETSQGIKIKKQYKLIPIDHGLCFPDNFEIYNYQVLWIDFPQITQPFTQNQLKYIDSLNPAQDVYYLKQRLQFRPLCLRNFRIASILLKQAAKLGMTLYDISQIMYRKDVESSESEQDSPRSIIKKKQINLSDLQKLVVQAQSIYNVVKNSGLKSSVYYQIGLIHPRNNMMKTKLSCIEQQQTEDEIKKIFTNNKEKNEKTLKRGISLPSLKLTSFQVEQQDEKQSPLLKQIGSKKQKTRKDKKDQKSLKNKQEQKEWQDIFFHYFEDILSRYLKIRQQKTIKRSRFKSQCFS